MPANRFAVLALAAAITLAGCARQQQVQESSPAPADAAPAGETKAGATAPPPPPVLYAEFAPETLYTLLVAEIAAQRGRYDVTLVNYLKAARETRDPAVVAHAMRVAQFLKAENAQIEVAKVWLDIDPNNLEAHQISAFQLIRRNEFPQALEHMEAIMRLGGDADFDRLAAYSQTLPAEDQNRLLELFRQLQSRHPDNLEVQYSLALIMKNTGRTDEAIGVITPVIDKHPDYLPGIFLYGTLLFDKGEIDEALSFLRKNARKFPDDRKIGTLYARMLVDDKQLQAAEDEFELLMTRFPDTPGLKLSHALVALENGHHDIAAKELSELLEQGEHPNEAHYYLGRIEDEAGRTDNAIEHFLQVESGSHYFAALSRAMYLTAKEGELDEALGYLAQLRERTPAQNENLWIIEVNLLMDLSEDALALASADQALIAFPGNTRLRYARAMLRDKVGNLDGMEEDLREVLKQEPENAIAMNALGYTLVDKTSRLQEGKALIEKAHTLRPDSAAIIDSLGWAYFREGNFVRAKELLEQAYGMLEDPEISAHLGELYWVTGEQDDARAIWKVGLERFPNAPVILKTIRRLDPGALDGTEP